MKVLVTGGAGFIGSNLCEKLVKQNYDIKRENIKDHFNLLGVGKVDGY